MLSLKASKYTLGLLFVIHKYKKCRHCCNEATFFPLSHKPTHCWLTIMSANVEEY